MIVVDSSIWIDYFNGKINRYTEYLKKLGSNAELTVGDVILVEVLRGFRIDEDYRIARAMMRRFEAVDMLGHENAVRCAENFRALRKRGITIRSTMDVVIASWCIAHERPLLFQDKDFVPFVDHFGLDPAPDL